MSRRRRWLIGVVVAILVLGVSAAGGAWWFAGFRPDPARYPVRGIDVSHHQGQIDWRAVAGDDVAFVYIKASEGVTHRDTRFADNWSGARRAGLAVGAYHFFVFCRPGADQAETFLATVPHEADALPPAVDLEFGGNCGLRPDGPTLRRELLDFLEPIERRDGKRAIFYVTPEFYAAYGRDLPARGLWRRSIVLAPSRDAAWTLWQYHNRGQVKGVGGPVDLNVFSGGRAAFAMFAGRP